MISCFDNLLLNIEILIEFLTSKFNVPADVFALLFQAQTNNVRK